MNPALKERIRKVPGVTQLLATRNYLRRCCSQTRIQLLWASYFVPGNSMLTALVHNLIIQAEKHIHQPTEDFLAALERAKIKFNQTADYREDLSIKLQVIKLINVLVNKHEYLAFSINKVGRPVGFMLDVANACQLGCPSCQHSSNKEWTAKTFVPIPVGTMKPDVYETFIRAVGLHSYNGHFYNNSEPLLNKRLPQYLQTANLHQINTFISTNFSLPNLDAEALVTSGLNTLMTAIDGITQDVYGRYRRGGNLELVLENVRRVVAAKKRLNSPTPLLRWQFLTFQHNIHQVDGAIKLARELGFNSFNIATPFDVSMDDPSIEVVEHPLVRSQPELVFSSPVSVEWKQSLGPITEEIERRFNENLVERYEAASGECQETWTAVQPRGGYCDWLNLGVIGDALGRIHPCCLPDYESQGSFVFASLKSDADDFFNSDKYRRARLLFRNEKAYRDRANLAVGRENKLKCDGCSSRPLPQIGLGSVRGYFLNPTSAIYGEWLKDPHIQQICLGWSKHTAEHKHV